MENEGMRQIVVRLTDSEYTRAEHISSKLGIGIPDFLSWLVRGIDLPTQTITVTESNIAAASSVDLVKIPDDFDKEKLRVLLGELSKKQIAHTLEKELRIQLLATSVQGLRVSSYERLSRWCHPKRWTQREKDAKPIAEAISQEVFGRVIDRVR